MNNSKIITFCFQLYYSFIPFFFWFIWGPFSKFFIWVLVTLFFILFLVQSWQLIRIYIFVQVYLVNRLEHVCKLKYPTDTLKFFYFILFTLWDGGEGKSSAKNIEPGLNNVWVIEEYLKESYLMELCPTLRRVTPWSRTQPWWRVSPEFDWTGPKKSHGREAWLCF